MANRKRALRAAILCGAALGAAVIAAAARASFHTFQIDELYSSPDGLVQFVELHEFLGADGQEFLTGHTLTSKQGATTRTYAFPSNLPDAFTADNPVPIAAPEFRRARRRHTGLRRAGRVPVSERRHARL